MFYSRKEAAQLWGISVRSLDYMIERGVIAVVRIGRRVLIQHKELERFARQNQERRVQ
jgi:excisionase family DNA binding protein